MCEPWYGRKVVGHDQEVLRILRQANVAKRAVVVIVAIDPLEAGWIEVNLM